MTARPDPSVVIIRPWPALMPAPLAADYLGFTGKNPAAAFLKAVGRGLYPPAVHHPGERKKWRKVDLDREIERLAEAEPEAEDEWDVA
ncbi:hypothetical protein [Henriciella sp.]|uniref:hypothetical protein n=1 Tax=Henriciella sp. TaxID=1968823 RepID=UPI00260FDC82|nr:hypothetical protein [Henriciella sp.]